MYLSDGERNITDFTLSYWRSMIQVFIFNVFSFLICFDFKTIVVKKKERKKKNQPVALGF